MMESHISLIVGASVNNMLIKKPQQVKLDEQLCTDITEGCMVVILNTLRTKDLPAD